MPTIRIDDEVYAWLKSRAIPFEDTPNSVLRRLAGLDKRDGTEVEKTQATKSETEEKKGSMPTIDINSRRIDGKYLNNLWKVNAKHALYHQDGTFYENLHQFPGALFDPNGYVLFNTEKEYNSCRYLSIGEKLNVHQGIASIPGYVRMR